MYGPAFFVVLGCFVCQLGLRFGYAVHALAGDIISEFDWDRVNYSEAHSWQIWVVAFASPLVGGLAARFGAKRILVAATSLLTAIFFLYATGQIWGSTESPRAATTATRSEQYFNRIAQVIDVAERIGAARVAHQPEQRLGEFFGDAAQQILERDQSPADSPWAFSSRPGNDGPESSTRLPLILVRVDT